MKRLGILTCHNYYNEGALLQTISTFMVLKKMYPDLEVEVIDYTPFTTYIALIRARLSLGNIKLSPAYNRRHKLFYNCRRNYLSLSKYRVITNDYSKALKSIRNKYDVIVVGSDEVWKVEYRKCARPFPNLFWLGDVGNVKKVSYAASGNRTAYRELTKDGKGIIKSCLRDFDLISVRDDHTFKMAEYFGVDHNLFKVPDPTFVFDFKLVDVKEKLSHIGVDSNKPMIGVSLFSKQVSKYLYEYYSTQGYQVVSLGFYNDYCDYNLYDKFDPIEWVSIISLLKIYITNRFHGAIFSMKTGTPFYSIDETNDYGDYESKIARLLKDCNIFSDYYSVLNDNLNIKALVKRIDNVINNHQTSKINKFLEDNRITGMEFIRKIGELK